MSLRKLYGDTGMTTWAGLPFNNGYEGSHEIWCFAWIPKFGLAAFGMGVDEYASNAWNRVTLDGGVADISVNGGYPFNWYNTLYDAPSQSLRLLDNNTSFLYQLEPVVLRPYQVQNRFVTNVGGVDMATLRWTSVGDVVYAYGTDGTLEYQTQANVPGGGFGALLRGRTDTELLAYTTGSSTFPAYLRFFDTVARVWSPAVSLGKEYAWVCYDGDNDVIVAIDTSVSPYAIAVFSLDVVPANVSNPVLVAGNTSQGSVATYQTTVTGDEGAPVAGIVVSWTLTGSGTLLTPTSLTDSDGNATAQVSYALGAAGTIGLTAEVAY